jgi:hypothetical protein
MERNHLTNGRFLHDLDDWVLSDAAYYAGDGDEHYGTARVQDGGSIAQEFSVPYTRVYSLHLALKPDSDVSGSEVTATATDGDGNTVKVQNLTGSTDTWGETTVTLGLAPGTTYTLTLSNASGGVVLFDDVWVYHVPTTRANVAARVNAKLGQLATDQGLDTFADGDLTEGDFTYAVDAGLRSIGAINPETGEPDVRYVEPEQVAALIDAVEQEMLERLVRDYSTVVDIAVGPRRESRSQTAQMLQDQVSKRGGAKVQVRKLRHRADDYEMG